MRLSVPPRLTNLGVELLSNQRMMVVGCALVSNCPSSFLGSRRGIAALAESAQQDPAPKLHCLVNASELPSGTPTLMCPTRSLSGSF